MQRDTLWYPQPITIRQTEGPELWTCNMMDKKDEILRLFVQRLRNQLGDHLKHIVLFGSRARGDDLPGSDYDCMAILDNISPSLNDAIDKIAGEFLCEHNALFSIFSVTEKRYREQIYNPLFMNVEKEGISL